MTDLRTTTVATVGFEAARQVDILPVGHRSRNLHGHSFQASVFAELQQGWAPFPGGEVSALDARLQDVIRPLDYAHLNRVIDVPTDENLARWIRGQLQVGSLDRVAVQSTPNSGVDLDRGGTAHVWRRYAFQAAHRLPHVGPQHKCGRMHGHAFEVIVHANQDLGSAPISIDYDELDRVWVPLQFALNYRCLNDIVGLANPTSELLSSWLWERLKDVIPPLSWITVYETRSCGANFDGSTYRIWKDFTLDSASRLATAPASSVESRLHGHTYLLRLHLSAPLDTVMGWTIDFGDVKEIFDPIFKALDHHPLYEIADLQDNDTGSIAMWVLTQARRDLPQLTRVDLFERHGCGSIVACDMRGPVLPVQ